MSKSGPFIGAYVVMATLVASPALGLVLLALLIAYIVFR